MIRSLLFFALLAACAPDQDGDGFDASEDCNDLDRSIYPGAVELCDGTDSNCDGLDESDGDGDGYRTCAECDDTRADVFPGAPSTCDGVDADCDGSISDVESAELGRDPACPAESCSDLHAARPELGDGRYWVADDSGVPAFQVDCDMTTDGGGWLALSIAGDAVLVASNDPTNAWHKCADDATEPWPWLRDEAEVDEDYPGTGRFDEWRPWARPSDRYRYSQLEVEVLARGISELYGDVKLVASTNDDDGNSWQDGGNGGLEAYAVAADGTWFLLTPGTGGECGGATGWPADGVFGMQYHWSMTPGESTWQGTPAEDAEDFEMGALPPELAMPVGFVLATFTGGGVAVGYDAPRILVR